jgi:hypothetical protein
VRFPRGLLSGAPLSAKLLDRMTRPLMLGGRLPGRVWRTTGFGIGLMIGEMTDVGLAVGHPGAGPGGGRAVYGFVDQNAPRTIAAFAEGDDEGSDRPRGCSP